MLFVNALNTSLSRKILFLNTSRHFVLDFNFCLQFKITFIRKYQINVIQPKKKSIIANKNNYIFSMKKKLIS